MNDVKKILNLFDKQSFMKIITLLLLINCTFSFSQNYFTRGELYDFEVGDVIQSQYYYNQYNSFTSKKYLSKDFSSNNDTVYYTIEQGVYIPACCAPEMETTFTLDTITEYYYNLSDTIRFDIPIPLTFEDSCNNMKDSLYIFNFGGNCPITTYKYWTNPLPFPAACSIEFYSEFQTYFKGLGYYYSTSYYDIQSVNTGTYLLYYKKGSETCGNFVNKTIELNLSNEVKLFPNPASDKIEIQSHFYFNSYDIYAIDGSKILSENLNSKEIVLSDLKAGIYFLELKSKANTIARKRFVKN